ncbi:MAG: glycosyltransferase [Bacteroidaceae bacterium]|nr:glycosyltransferase [Bacteroidaceae bacterium]
MNEKGKYKYIKARLHTQPTFENDQLLAEIEEFGKQCHSRRLYKKLKRKYWWHRIAYPRHLPLGTVPKVWADKRTPLVSVIVPNFCHAPYLQERIDCILNQTFQNFELILLDDCSTDNSREILFSYKDHPKVSHVVFNEQNTGNTFLQWEKGVNLAQGEYIWIAESDDYADETFLDYAMGMFCLHEDCVMVRAGSYQVNENGRVMVRDWDVWKEDETARYYDGNKYIRHNMLHFNYIYNASMVVFRKDVFQAIDKTYQQLRYTGDWQCWISMLMHGSICEYRRKLNYFRQHQDKVSAHSTKTNKGMIDQINVLAYAINHVKMSALRKLMIRGEQFSHCLQMSQEKYAPDVLAACWTALSQNLHATIQDYKWYKFFLHFKCLPFIPTLENDKYK